MAATSYGLRDTGPMSNREIEIQCCNFNHPADASQVGPLHVYKSIGAGIRLIFRPAPALDGGSRTQVPPDGPYRRLARPARHVPFAFDEGQHSRSTKHVPLVLLVLSL
jgi:hypothetical protein